jgi:pimeloyl-ACP methyl ester carboxylesterase
MEPPGFGFSTPHSGFSFSWEDSSEAVEEFLRHINRPPYVLIAPCVLGLAALQVAERMPKEVSHLVLEQVTINHNVGPIYFSVPLIKMRAAGLN